MSSFDVYTYDMDSIFITWGEFVEKVNVREARQHIGKLLDKVISGEQIVITRRGKPVAQMSIFDQDKFEKCKFPNRQNFRARFPKVTKSATQLIREMRDERG